MDVEQHADAAGAQKPGVSEIEADGVPPLAQFRRDGLLQFVATFTINSPGDQQVDPLWIGQRIGQTPLHCKLHRRSPHMPGLWAQV